MKINVEKLKILMIQRRWNVLLLAKYSRVSTNTIYKIFSGKTNVQNIVLMKIATALNVYLDEFIED